jgi:hypothetical protein
MNKLFRLILNLSLLIVLSFNLVTPALAQPKVGDVLDTVQAPEPVQSIGGPQATTGAQKIQVLINRIIRVIYVVASIALVIMLLWGALQWITSGGSKEAIAQGRGRIINALIGFAILAFAFVIAKFAGGVFGFDPFSPPKL